MSRFGESYKICRLKLSYPLSEIFSHQDLSNAAKFLKEVSFKIDEDLGLRDYEGSISYIAPIDDETEISNHKILVRHGSKKISLKNIRIDYSDHSGERLGLSKSSMHDREFSVFRDGILIPTASVPNILSRRSGRYDRPELRMLVNISQKKAPQINVSRTNFVDQENWFDPIEKAYSKKIGDEYITSLLSQDPINRLFKMGWIHGYHNILLDDLFMNFPLDYWPVAFFKANGRLEVRNFKDIKNNSINLFPDDTYGIIEKGEITNILYSYLYGEKYAGFLTKWRGDSVLLELNHFLLRSSLRFLKMTNIISSVLEISALPFKMSHHLGPILFVKPPWKGNPPLVQHVLLPNESSTNKVDIEVLMEKAVSDQKSLAFSDLGLLAEAKTGLRHHFPRQYVYFSEPFDHHFGFGGKLINIGHPIGGELFRLHYYSLLHPAQARKLKSLMEDFFEHLSGSSSIRIDDINKILEIIWSTAREIKQFNFCEIERTKLAPDDFIQGTLTGKKAMMKEIMDYSVNRLDKLYVFKSSE